MSKGLVAVPIIRLVAGVDGHLEARGAVLDKDGELLVNHSSGWLNGEVQATLLSVHPEPTANRGNHKSAAWGTSVEAAKVQEKVTDTENGIQDSRLACVTIRICTRRASF